MTDAAPATSLCLLLIGTPGTEFRTAAGMAEATGAHVCMADTPADAMAVLRTRGVRLVMIDVEADVAGFMAQLRSHGFAVPVIACGIDAPATVAVAAIRAGARDYVPLPPDLDLIAAAIASVGSGGGLEVDALVGQTVEAVERELILQTLTRCRGNRTSASSILGISVRTMRNKLKTFIEAGIPVAPAA